MQFFCLSTTKSITQERLLVWIWRFNFMIIQVVEIAVKVIKIFLIFFATVNRSISTRLNLSHFRTTSASRHRNRLFLYYTGSSVFIDRTLSGYKYEMKQNCEFLQMYLCRIKSRETIPKISFNMPTIFINYRLKTFREILTRVTNGFLEEFGLLLPQFDL